MVKDFHLYEYNKGMETRKWSEDGQKKEAKTSSLQSEKKTTDQEENKENVPLRWELVRGINQQGSSHEVFGITKLIADIEDRHHGPCDAMHNPP
ncbi:hypothetical protein Tco_0686430 [Tanacetum coccineum]